MGAALQVISGRVTNPGAAVTPTTPATGDTFQVQNFDSPASATLIDAWVLGATAGILSIHSPRMHDNIQGIRAKALAATSAPLLPDYACQPLVAQDVLIAALSGGGAETDGLSFLNYYSDLPGANARLFGWNEIKPRIRNILTNEVSIVTGATVGDYGGGVAINSLFDLLKANVDYAVLGYNTDTAVQTVGLRGPDTSNFRLGGPGSNSRIETRDWFTRLSELQGLPLIPVFNAANKGATIVDLVHNAAGTTVIVDLILAELAS